MTDLRQEHGLGGDPEAKDWQPRQHEAALRYMRRPAFMRSRTMRDIRMRTHYGDCHPDIIVFAIRLYDMLEEHRIPVRIHVYDPSIKLHAMAAEWLRRGLSPVEEALGPMFHRRLVMIEHATMGLDLPALSWQVLRGVARQVAQRTGIALEDTRWREHPWMFLLGELDDDKSQLAAKAEFRRLERVWLNRFNKAGRDPFL